VGVELDHVLIAVPDLADAGERLAENFGIASVEGGIHPGRGTGNRIVPLGQSYLELISVIDEASAGRDAFGRWVAANASGRGRPLGWAVRVDDLDAVAARLTLAIEEGSRHTPDGADLRWRTAGGDRATGERFLPFFIEWAAGTPHPGDTEVRHPAGELSIAGLELEGDGAALAGWLGGAELPVTVRAGTPAVTRVVLAGSAGQIFLDAETL